MIISSTALFSYTPIRLPPLLLINCAFMRGGGSFIATQKSQPILRHATNIHWQLNIETLGIKLLYGFLLFFNPINFLLLITTRSFILL
jgi:hypothetical protein